MKEISLSAIILTHNEEKNIEKCFASIHGWVRAIFIVDAFSCDKTVEIAKSFGADVYQNPWVNYATQFNWALANLPIESEWLMRLDADERVTFELKRELLEKLPNFNKEISGLYMKRRVYFMGRWIKHGGYYPTWLLRIWRRDKGYCEERWMDEHIKSIEGKAVFLENDIIEENLNNITWWINKHNLYATREAIDSLNIKHRFLKFDAIPAKLWGSQEQSKRWLKEEIYSKAPLFLRSFFYFIYRYFVRLGFLDGREGLVWHFLQGFWYRFLVDAKIYEIYKKAGTGKDNIKGFIKEDYGVDL